MPDESEETAPVEGEEPAAQEQPAEPAQPAGPDYGPTFSRYQQAGLDLENMDPAALAQAHALHTRVQGKRVFTEDELPARFQEYVLSLPHSPQGKQVLERLKPFLGRRQATVGDVGDPESPEQLQIAQLREQYQQLQQGQQTLMQARDQILAEREAERQYKATEQHLHTVIGGMPGARELPRLRKDFWRDVAAGLVPETALNAAGIKAWVRQYLSEVQAASPQPARRPAPSARARGGKAKNKEVEELDLDDVTDFLAEQKWGVE